MSNRIINLFREQNKNVLSVFYTAGYPDIIDTIAIAKYLAEAGADIIEIGIPFSDPVADGPTIQESNKIALDKGMNLHLLIDQVKEIRKTVNLPIILMGYLNPVMRYGVEKFLADASAAGVDGLIIPDMPLHEFSANYKELFKQNALCNTFLISPTTSLERIKQIDEATHGFIYAVSASSTTGARNDFSSEQLHYFDKLKKLNLKNPFLIGFGISNHATFSKAAEYGSGAIVGSAFVQLLKASLDFKADITRFVKELKNSAA
jgi:tryptophan synthase alpha chain